MASYQFQIYMATTVSYDGIDIAWLDVMIFIIFYAEVIVCINLLKVQ